MRERRPERVREGRLINIVDVHGDRSCVEPLLVCETILIRMSMGGEGSVKECCGSWYAILT